MKKFIKCLVDCKMIYVLSGLLITAGVVILVADLTWVRFPATFYSRSFHHERNDELIKIALWCLGIGLVGSLATLVQLHYTKPQVSDANYSKIMFGQCLCGIGFVLLLDALVNVVAVSGFAKAGTLPYLFESGTYSTTNVSYRHRGNDPTNSPGRHGSNRVPTVVGATPTDTNNATTSTNAVVAQDSDEAPPALASLDRFQTNIIKALQLLFALGFTIMGALFFFAKSLWVKMQSNPIVQFDERIFWAGLWFRLGEAVVFTVVVFLALLYKHFSDGLSWMPFIALIIGISVKAAENFIAGITERLLDSVKAFVSK